MSDVYELRQYTLHPGRRDTLIELFERELVTGQEACGMRIVGQFRDADDPDRFVWFRAFPDMEKRRDALTCFYSGAVWKANRDTANATMIHSDDVLLLREVAPRRAFPEPRRGGAASRFTITVYSFPHAIDDELLALVKRKMPAMTLLQTEPAENTFPALPVRLGEHVIVSIARGESDVPAALTGRLAGPPRRLTLEPTAGSCLR